MIGVQKSNMANQKSAWQEHVERIAEKGVLAKQLYVVLTQPSGSLDAVRDNFPSIWPIRLNWNVKTLCSPPARLLMIKNKNGKVKAWL